MNPRSDEPAQIPDLVMDTTFNGHDHDWVQSGTHLICSSCVGNSRHGTIIPVGLMLVGSRGDWKLVPEHSTRRSDVIIKTKEPPKTSDSQ